MKKVGQNTAVVSNTSAKKTLMTTDKYVRNTFCGIIYIEFTDTLQGRQTEVV